MTLPQRVRLSFSGMTAELTQDTLTETGVVLSIGTQDSGMAEQSHVEAGDPDFLLHDYLRRMRSVMTTTDRVFDGGPPRSALHLGAGALTLPRWMQQRWPGLTQTAVDIEPELIGFVLEHLPMDPAPQSVVADAASVLGPSGQLAGRRYDVVVVDLFNSAQAPASLTSETFFRQVLGAAEPQGLMLVNFGDDADMRFARQLTSTLLAAMGDRADHALLTAPDSVLSTEEEGNLVFAATPTGPFSDAELHQIWATGPHPGDVLSGQELMAWSQR